ncbi:MAG: hypothetical protein HeimC3_53740 [Candidatus Heimdallarchaeota archaeon LC_3]|nr:MAG: hypothetical protein HeimC3_53740 [Candidatus Heimdallarchaeota archaeon LC_3]
MVNYQNIYKKCLKGQLKDQKFTGTTIKDHVKSPMITYCDAFVPDEKKDPITIFSKYITNRGIQHEKNVIQDLFPNSLIKPDLDQKEGFLLAINKMSQGLESLAGFPFYYVPNQFFGYLDVIRINNSKSSIFGDFFYEIIEIKSANNIKTPHKLQGAFYNRIIGLIQDYIPEKFFIINGKSEESEYSYSEYSDKLDDIIEEISEIWKGTIIPEANFATESFQWKKYNNELAIIKSDISLISGVGGETKKILYENGFDTIEKIANASVEQLTMKKIKTKAPIFNQRAKALHFQEIIKIQDGFKDEIENLSEAIFLDLEDLDSYFVPSNLDSFIFIYGILIKNGKQMEFIPIINDTPKTNDESKNKFLYFLEKLQEYPKYKIFHWGSHEKTVLKKEAEKFDSLEKFEEIEIRLMNLKPIVEKYFAFPIYSYSIKDVANYLGFSWKETDMEGLSAVVKFLEYLEDKSKKSIIESLVMYNKDDVLALNYVLEKLFTIS